MGRDPPLARALQLRPGGGAKGQNPEREEGVHRKMDQRRKSTRARTRGKLTTRARIRVRLTSTLRVANVVRDLLKGARRVRRPPPSGGLKEGVERIFGMSETDK